MTTRPSGLEIFSSGWMKIICNLAFLKLERLFRSTLYATSRLANAERYEFIEFNSHSAAEKVLQSYNGTMMPNTKQAFCLNWAGFSTGDRRLDAGFDLSIFVGDLATDVTDEMLQDIFGSRYPSVKGAIVVVDLSTGRPKGYGFVRFGNEYDRSQALTEMNIVCCSSRPMRVGVATPKKSSVKQQYSSQAVVFSGGYAPNGAVRQSVSDSPNTTIFVGGLDSDVTDEELKQFFTPFGDILSVKIPAGKGCGFVQFADRSNAEEAIQMLSGTIIGKPTVRLSWGRNMVNKQMRMDSINAHTTANKLTMDMSTPKLHLMGGLQMATLTISS